MLTLLLALVVAGLFFYVVYLLVDRSETSHIAREIHYWNRSKIKIMVRRIEEEKRNS